QCTPILNYFHPTFPFFLPAVKVIQPYRVVTTNGTAQLSEEDSMPYPYPGPEELRVTLLKGLHGTQKVCSSVLILKEQREIKEEIEGEVTVSGLKATDTDMYRCEIEVFYPPPYLRLTGNGTLIHVIGETHTTYILSCAEDDEGDENMAPVSVPVVILVILVIFVLIIIIYLQVRALLFYFYSCYNDDLWLTGCSGIN
uniref:Immunoglobulin V-set domain-containing protein n=1 Tax=Dicentrarchus labrax TaxID=13489 RepID=A0A8C4GGP1_DICLA